MLYVMTLILAVVVWMVASVTRPRRSIWFSLYSLVTVVAAITVAPVLIAAGIATAADVGLFQRAILGSLNIWILAFACLTFVERRGPASKVSGRNRDEEEPRDWKQRGDIRMRSDI
jgi:hypothetical protein